MLKGTKMNLTEAERERRREHGRRIGLNNSARAKEERLEIEGALEEVGRRILAGELPNPIHEDQILEVVNRILQEREVEKCLRANPDKFIDHGDGTYSLAEWGCVAAAELEEAFAGSHE